MCVFSKPKVTEVQKATATPPPPPPAETATAVREPGSSGSQRTSDTLDKRRKGRGFLRISREPVTTNVPSSGAGVNV